MTEFDKAFNITMAHEGGFVNDSADRGGMTYRGISRRYHPSWPGWPIIDTALAARISPDTLFTQLDPAVRSFYKVEFWDRCNGDNLPGDVAAEVFDSAVNCGVTQACQWLQQSMNLLNRNGKDYPDLAEDGKLGPATLRVLSAFMQKKESLLLLKMLNILQGSHYIVIMQKTPSQERFARGWLSRVKL